MTTTGEIIKSNRLSVNATLQSVLDAGGPSKAYQSEVENGKRDNVGALTLIRWCDAIGCDPVFVFAEIVRETKREAVDKFHGTGI